jgi:hypothetical protein
MMSRITKSEMRLGKWLSSPGVRRMIVGGIITKALCV